MPPDQVARIADLPEPGGPAPQDGDLIQRVAARPAVWASLALLVGLGVLWRVWPAAVSALWGATLAGEVESAGLLAVAMTLAMAAGGIDLSLGAVMALSAGLAGSVEAAGGPAWLGALGAVAAGIAVGLANGLLIALAGLPPAMVTLASLAGAGALAAVLRDRAGSFGWTGSHPFWIWLAGATLLALLLHVTVWGRHLRAVGGNARAARDNGVRVNRVVVSAYVLSATLATLAGGHSAAPVTGVAVADLGPTLQAVAAAIIGGASLAGGEGGVAGALVGAMSLVALRHALMLAGLAPDWLGVVVAGVIVAALLAVRRRIP